MKITTFKRNDGFVTVVMFDNKESCAVSTKTFKTQAATKFGQRIIEVCGHKWEKRNLPWETTNPITGEITRNFKREEVIGL